MGPYGIEKGDLRPPGIKTGEHECAIRQEPIPCSSLRAASKGGLAAHKRGSTSELNGAKKKKKKNRDQVLQKDSSKVTEKVIRERICNGC